VTATRKTSATAALSGIATGVQAHGVWAGYRQIFVRFAGEAETATMYTPEAMIRHVDRALERARPHSIAIAGRDPLAGVNFLMATFQQKTPPLPVMLDVDVPRPEAVAEIAFAISMVQVTIDFSAPSASSDRVLEMLAVAAQAKLEHALVLPMREGLSDALVLRLIEQAHAVSMGTKIVVHPVPGEEKRGLDRRYMSLLEQATSVHPDVRLALPLPSPVGVR
jgi:hypothetical protein